MKFFKIFPKTLIIILGISVVFFIYISCSTKNVNNGRGLKNTDGNVYAGSQVCASCHSNIYSDFSHTAHFHTSSIPTDQNIKGSFFSGENIFPYDYSTFMVMEKRNGKFYQTEYQSGKETRSEQFYVVIGSGTRGQSYLYIKDSQLYQLPISYFTSSHSWANSPGFPFYAPMFTRYIRSRCLECHSTFADMAALNVVDKESKPKNIIFGIECESCHGPAEKHVEFQQQNAGLKTARFIINPSHLTRQKKIEMCGYCHSQGKTLNTSKPFTFKPGDDLKKFLIIDTSADTSHIDVHGNQTALLALSRCFKSSQLVCTTCHDTHKQERGNIALFSNRCMNCHNIEHNSFCKFTSLPSSILKNNCIDCHMPAKQSKVLTVNLNQSQQQTPAIIRSHFITVYPDETAKFLKLYNNEKNN